MTTPNPQQDESYTELRNEISAELYGMYYYEFPNNMEDAKDIVRRAAKFCATEIKKAEQRGFERAMTYHNEGTAPTTTNTNKSEGEKE